MGVCTVQSHRTPCLEDSRYGSVLCCHHLDILNDFWIRALCFRFTVGPMNYIAQSCLKNLLKHITGLTSRKAGSLFAFMTKSQVELFLLVRGPHFESHLADYFTSVHQSRYVSHDWTGSWFESELMVSLIIARMYVLLKASISSWLVELSFLMFKISHQHFWG